MNAIHKTSITVSLFITVCCYGYVIAFFFLYCYDIDFVLVLLHELLARVYVGSE